MVSNIVLEALSHVLETLKNRGINYALFGGLAMSAYRHIRATKDVDIMITLQGQNIKEMIATMEKAGFSFDRKTGIKVVKEFRIFRFAYRDRTYGLEIYVDLVNAETGFQKEVIRRKKTITLWDKEINFASCEDLILLKILGSRPIDIVDAQALWEENRNELDKSYLKTWAERLGIEAKIKEILA